MTIIRVIFALFLIYTWFYILQWIVGILISINALSRTAWKKTWVKLSLPTKLAKRHTVSAIIAAYNEEACVTDTIDSLLEEDYRHLEIILVDDGSTDRMAEEVFDRYSLEFSRDLTNLISDDAENARCYEQIINGRKLVFLQKNNGGKAHALNCGLKLSTGRYCMVLDADTKVSRGSVRMMVSQFLADRKTVVCAGVVGNDDIMHTDLPLLQRALVAFQTLEYYRTFYMQRILLDKINANIVVSGAFAMFDGELLRAIGGYRENTIGEDMELSMRLHAFCQSQNRPYKIAFIPYAKCTTQFPFSYRDFARQRRRWQIGMIQSLLEHRYMLVSHHYGWAGLFSGTLFLVYELFAPFIELLGVVTLVAAYFMGILDIVSVSAILLAYYGLMIIMQAILIFSLNVYGVEKIPLKRQLFLLTVACMEFITFHLIHSAVKVAAIVTYRKYRKTWQHIRRSREMALK